jgi:small-conductance mechanosensitive channel
MTDGGAAGSSPGLLDSLQVGGLATGVLVLAGTWFAVRVTRRTLQRLGNRFGGRRLLLSQVATVASFLLYMIGIGLAVGLSFTLSQEAALALAGAIAMTAGFALKDLAASILAGLMIIIDRPFQVGDRVTFGGIYGEVTAIGLRSVRLLTLDDNVVTIPNNKFLTDVVASGNWGQLDMMVQMDFFVGADQDVLLARRLVEEALTSSRYVYAKKPWTVLVNELVEGNYFSIRLRAKAYVLDCKYEKAFETDVTERVIQAFREHDVRPPAVLHRSVAVASGADSAARAPEAGH